MAVPLDRPPQTFFEGNGRTKTEQLLRAGRVERAPRLAVRLARVPADARRENPISLAIMCVRSKIEISKPAPRLTGSAPSNRSVARRIARAASSTNRNSRDARARAPGDDLRLAGVDGILELHDQRRNDVGGRGVEIVAGAVEIDRQQVNDVRPVLLPIRLPLDQQHLLGQAIRRVRLLGITIPQRLLPERDGRELGIRTDGAHRHHFGHRRAGGILRAAARPSSGSRRRTRLDSRDWRRCHPLARPGAARRPGDGLPRAGGRPSRSTRS